MVGLLATSEGQEGRRIQNINIYIIKNDHRLREAAGR